MSAFHCLAFNAEVTLTLMSDNATPLIILLRPQEQAERYAALCNAEFGAKADVLIAPLMRIDMLPQKPTLEPKTQLIFTSENGVRTYIAQGGNVGRRAYCVGDRTAKAAKQVGLDAVSAKGRVTDLAELIRNAAPTAPLIHLHGTHVRGDLAADLRAAGLNASSFATYSQVPEPLTNSAVTAIQSPRPTVLPLFSPRSAALLAERITQPQNCCYPCISKATLQALPAEMQAKAEIADEPNGKAMLNCISRQLCT